MVWLLICGFVFIAGISTGGTIAERTLARQWQKLARQRRAFWEERQEVMTALELRHQLERAERLRRIARERAEAAPEHPTVEPPDWTPPGHSAA